MKTSEEIKKEIIQAVIYRKIAGDIKKECLFLPVSFSIDSSNKLALSVFLVIFGGFLTASLMKVVEKFIKGSIGDWTAMLIAGAICLSIYFLITIRKGYTVFDLNKGVFIRINKFLGFEIKKQEIDSRSIIEIGTTTTIVQDVDERKGRDFIPKRSIIALLNTGHIVTLVEECGIFEDDIVINNVDNIDELLEKYVLNDDDDENNDDDDENDDLTYKRNSDEEWERAKLLASVLEIPCKYCDKEHALQLGKDKKSFEIISVKDDPASKAALDMYDPKANLKSCSSCLVTLLVMIAIFSTVWYFSDLLE